MAKTFIIINKGAPVKVSGVYLKGLNEFTTINEEQMALLNANPSFNLWVEKGFITLSDNARKVEQTQEDNMQDALDAEKQHDYDEIFNRRYSEIESEDPSVHYRTIEKMARDSLLEEAEKALQAGDEDYDLLIGSANHGKRYPKEK